MKTRIYDYQTDGPKGAGKPYYSFCSAPNPQKAFIIAMKHWREEYGTPKRMVFTVWNTVTGRIWKYHWK